MAFTVLISFSDVQDNQHVYGVGDEYPRPGYVASPERIKTLTGSSNTFGRPIIREVPKETAETSKEEPETAENEPEKVVAEEVTAKPEKTRKRAKKAKE